MQCYQILPNSTQVTRTPGHGFQFLQKLHCTSPPGRLIGQNRIPKEVEEHARIPSLLVRTLSGWHDTNKAR